MINMKRYRLLVDIEPIEKGTAAGIILVQDEKMEAAGQQFGTVIAVGHTCWTNADGEAKVEPWCKVGDRILYARHAGRFVYDPFDRSKEFMVMNDTDVIAVITENEEFDYKKYKGSEK